MMEDYKEEPIGGKLFLITWTVASFAFIVEGYFLYKQSHEWIVWALCGSFAGLCAAGPLFIAILFLCCYIKDRRARLRRRFKRTYKFN